jgi:hypothetical protein
MYRDAQKNNSMYSDFEFHNLFSRYSFKDTSSHLLLIEFLSLCLRVLIATLTQIKS